MSKQFWNETLVWATASGAIVASSSTETILFPNVTIPANYMQDGRCLRLRAFGAYGTTATPTLVFTIRWGGVAGTILAKQAANVTTSGVGGGASMTALWDLEAYIQTRANGSSGSLMTNGTSTLYTSTLLTAGTVTNYGQTAPIASGSTGGTTPVAVTADLTADTALSLTVTWGTLNAANSIQGLNYTLESLN
jgi:F0F1-type ATP synthase membrane subunit a